MRPKVDRDEDHENGCFVAAVLGQEHAYLSCSLQCVEKNFAPAWWDSHEQIPSS